MLSPTQSASNGSIGNENAESQEPVTAGIIVIGDEILKGQTLDSNSHFMTKKLFSLGVKVLKISVIPDVLADISSEVALFSKKFTHVITTGGIGPTHDDLTFEGVAKAFGTQTEFHPRIVELITNWYKTSDLSSPQMKMAKVPRNAKLHFFLDPKTQKESKYPIVSVGNVYIFPGVPPIMEHAFNNLQHLFQNPNVQFHTSVMYVNVGETVIADLLTAVANEYKETLTIGSYPDMLNSYYKVKLALESTDTAVLEKVKDHLASQMPKDSIVQYEENPIANAHIHVYDLMKQRQDRMSHAVKEAVDILEDALDKYSLDDICIGFNGGKDCTVLLHLFYAVVRRKFPDFDGQLKTLYIRSRCPFPELEKFVQISRDRYNVEMINLDGRIKECLQTLTVNHPNIKAVIMGTRRTDPYSDSKGFERKGNLKPFIMTDSDWPQLMRVNPLLEWDYSHIWGFLRGLCLPYCTLYDRGYTSLGSINNTHPNPLLQYVDERDILSYRPAYQLADGSKERDGRN